MQHVKTVILALLVLCAVLAYASLSIVGPDQRALDYRLGQVVGTFNSPGVYFKWPFINTVRTVSASVQTSEIQQQQVRTADKKSLLLDVFVKWRIGSDLERYVTRFGAGAGSATQKLTDQTRADLRDSFRQWTFEQAVASDRPAITRKLTQQVKQAVAKDGIDVLDVRIARIDLPKDEKAKVYQRMKAQQESKARAERDQGQAKADAIRADADTSSARLLADARRKAEVARGEADVQAAGIYAEAAQKDPAFFRFFQNLQSYRRIFKDKSDLLLLSPQSEFLRYLNDDTKGN